MFSVIQVNRIYLIFNLVHFLVDSSGKTYTFVVLLLVESRSRYSEDIHHWDSPFFDDIGIWLVKKILHIPDAVNIFTLVTY